MLDNEYWRAIGHETAEFWHYEGNQWKISAISVSKDENENTMAMLSSAFVLPMAMALSIDVKSDITTWSTMMRKKKWMKDNQGLTMYGV